MYFGVNEKNGDDDQFYESINKTDSRNHIENSLYYLVTSSCKHSPLHLGILSVWCVPLVSSFNLSLSLISLNLFTSVKRMFEIHG